jgi:hypothetical protein
MLGDKLVRNLPDPVQERKEQKEEPEIPALLQTKQTKRGKVILEVRVYLHDEPMILWFSTEMRSHMLPSQLNRGWLTQKFKDMFREFGRVNDISRGS